VVVDSYQFVAEGGFDLDGHLACGDAAVDNVIPSKIALAELANSWVTLQLQQGNLLLFAEFDPRADWWNARDVETRLYFGRLPAGVTFDAARDFGGQGEFLVDSRVLDPVTKEALIRFTGDIENGYFFSAGEQFQLTVPTGGETPVVFTLFSPRFAAGIELQDDRLGGLVDGLFALALRRADIETALLQAEAAGVELFVSRETLLDLIGDADLDTDCDGTPDSYSLTLAFTARPARLTGIYEFVAE